MDLPGWNHLPPFTVRGYFHAISNSLDDIDTQWSRTTAFIAEWRKFWKPSDGEAEATMQSYLRQEAEAISLRAKLHVAERLHPVGVRAINLQHDGLVTRCGRLSSEKIRSLFTLHSSKALHYPQPVEIKAMKVDVPQEASLKVSPALPYHEAIKCPLFFDPRGPCAPNHASARIAREKLALKFARAGFYRIEHLLSPDGRSVCLPSVKSYYKSVKF